MWYLIIISIIVIGLLVGTGCKVSLDKNKTSIVNMKNPHDSIPEVYTKSDIEKFIQDLSKSEPKNLKDIGAMCYKMAAPPNRAEYICPVCGEKTLYTDDYAKLISMDLQSIREKTEKLDEINCKLDESQFCKSCSPQTEEPKLCIIVKLKDETEHKTCDINDTDLNLINEFLSGKNVHAGFYDEETPLKQYILRIEELLGVKIEKG